MPTFLRPLPCTVDKRIRERMLHSLERAENRRPECSGVPAGEMRDGGGALSPNLGLRKETGGPIRNFFDGIVGIMLESVSVHTLRLLFRMTQPFSRKNYQASTVGPGVLNEIEGKKRLVCDISDGVTLAA